MMGDVPLAYVETTGGVRVGEDDIVAVGKNDVSVFSCRVTLLAKTHTRYCHSKLEGIDSGHTTC